MREPLPRKAWFIVRYMWPPGDRPLCVGPGPPLPPRPLHLHLLPAPSHQGLLPRACRQALLPALFRQALRLTACGAPPPNPPFPWKTKAPEIPPPFPKKHALQIPRPCSLSLGLSPPHPVRLHPLERAAPKVLYSQSSLCQFRKGPANFKATLPQCGSHTLEPPCMNSSLYPHP